MPSAIAHGLVGASLASILPHRQRATWIAAAFALLAASPDLDVIGYRLGIPYAHPLGHRGLTHSLFFAAAIALISIPLWRRVVGHSAGAAALLTFLAIGSHGVLDAFTDAGLGIGLLIPFDNGRYFAPWRPILTSPLSVSAFVSPRGLTILLNEALWVGLPVVAFVVLVRAFRRPSNSARDST